MQLAGLAKSGDCQGDVGDQEVALPACQGRKSSRFQLLGTARESLGNDESVQENPTFVHPSWSGWLPCCWATRQPGRQWLQMFRSQQPLSLLTIEEFSSGNVCSHNSFGQDTTSKNTGTPTQVVIKQCSKILFCMQQLPYPRSNILRVLNYLDNFHQ